MENNLALVFQDTQQKLWENPDLGQLTRTAVMCTRVFPEKFETTRIMGIAPTFVSVTDETTLAAARRLAGTHAKVAVLNFANGVNPGGGVIYGADAQEESLCRCSNLYPCLVKPEIYEDFYAYNNRIGSSYSDRIIYSENITVFKTDDDIPEYTDEWFNVDVITCPPPNLNGISDIDENKLKKLYNNRIKNIFAVAEAHGVRALVLGAFGCDVFANPPKLMAEAFDEQIRRGDYKNVFREIVFAISIRNARDMQCMEIFKSVLSPWQKNPLYGKNVSIFGDSISTYWGSNPSGYKVYYEASHCLQSGIYSVEDTWWMRLLRSFGGHLLVNNSYMESTVTGTSRFCGNSDLRTYGMHQGTVLPDVILVFMGLEDFRNGVPIEPENPWDCTSDNYDVYFKPSYEMMLWKLKQAYPMAEIYCATLPPADMRSGRLDRFPYALSGVHLDDYNRAILSCALQYGCQIIDLRKQKIYYQSADGAHPDVQGMKQLADGWAAGIEAVSQKRANGSVVDSSDNYMKKFSAFWLIGSGLCLIFAVMFAAFFVMGLSNDWFESSVIACFTGIFPGIFLGGALLLGWRFFV